jgi:hypothetical protein
LELTRRKQAAAATGEGVASFSGMLKLGKLTAESKAWLKQYDVTEEEMARYGLAYDHDRDCLLFPLGVGEFKTWAARYFGTAINHPKALTFGPREHHAVYIHEKGVPKDAIVFVEDCVSAIKVGRLVHAYPLLGSYVSQGQLKRAAGEFATVYVWLDRDKAKESVVACSTASLYHKPFVPIITEKDPKEYSDAEIAEILADHQPFESKGTVKS